MTQAWTEKHSEAGGGPDPSALLSINDRKFWMQYLAGLRDIRSGDGVGEVDIREEKMKAVCLPDQLAASPLR